MSNTCTWPDVDCTYPREGNTLFCARHNHQQRKEARMKKDQVGKPVYQMPRSQTPIAKVSDKRKDKLVEFTPLKKAYLTEHSKCELMLIGCTKTAVDIHHCSMSDLDFLNTATWMAACRGCHTEVETKMSSKDRREKGFLI